MKKGAKNWGQSRGFEENDFYFKIWIERDKTIMPLTKKLNLYTKKASIFISSSQIQIGHEIHFTQAVGKFVFEMSSCNSYE